MNLGAAIGKRRSRRARSAGHARYQPSAINDFLARASRGLGVRAHASRESTFVASLWSWRLCGVSFKRAGTAMPYAHKLFIAEPYAVSTPF